ncbi:MAG: hypothetical protein IKH84_00785 [Ottowia sp.]|nr:hypothetical protein [Ottowia sp.]
MHNAQVFPTLAEGKPVMKKSLIPLLVAALLSLMASGCSMRGFAYDTAAQPVVADVSWLHDGENDLRQEQRR